MNLSLWERFKLYFEEIVSYVFLPLVISLLWFFFIVVMRYRIAHLKQMRQQFAQIIEQTKGQPLLICINHLTRIDSVVLARFATPFYKVFFNYSLLPWHVLDLANLPLLCHLLKTLPIERMGDRKKIRLMQDKVRYLLNKGDRVIIFPEGTRSTTGRLDTEGFQYGVGDILRELPQSKVLCVYLRSNKQQVKSNILPYGSIIDISFEVIQPTTTLEGLRASRDIARQVVAKLELMEKAYFAKQDMDRQ